MQKVKIDAKTTDEEINSFLSTLVVNAACTWSSHFSGSLHQLQQQGLQQWNNMGGRPFKTATDKKGNPEKLNWTGQIKDAATFAAGTAEITIKGGTAKQFVYKNPWTPSQDEPPVKAGKDLFWLLNGQWGRWFFQPGQYAQIEKVKQNLFKTSQIDLTVNEALDQFLIPGQTAKNLLSGATVVTASWTDSKIISGEIQKWL